MKERRKHRTPQAGKRVRRIAFEFYRPLALVKETSGGPDEFRACPALRAWTAAERRRSHEGVSGRC